MQNPIAFYHFIVLKKNACFIYLNFNKPRKIHIYLNAEPYSFWSFYCIQKERLRYYLNFHKQRKCIFISHLTQKPTVFDHFIVFKQQCLLYLLKLSKAKKNAYLSLT